MSAEQRLKAQVWRDEVVEQIRLANQQWNDERLPYAFPKWRKMKYEFIDPGSCGEWIHFLVLNNREEEADMYRERFLDTARRGPRDKQKQEQEARERGAKLEAREQTPPSSPRGVDEDENDKPWWWTPGHQELHQKMFGAEADDDEDNDNEDAEDAEVIEIIDAVAMAVDDDDADDCDGDGGEEPAERAERRRVRKQLEEQQASDAAFALALYQQDRRVRHKPMRVDPQFGKANVAVKYRAW